ncbi:hypothetical protein OTK49_03090 [Vibrio coralliirubri]|uniref:hypothetical protein n=1 Tax=Vibrio coralliirubri TaxID=1516159 RepID=UPI002284D6F0|nr:hypothetical protein [Vibrio coralliirubri]MCY9861501.1 hypothetical protein [Vibrio coralliirubri]
MSFESEYKNTLLEQAKLGDKQAITELASDESISMFFQVFPLIKNVDIETIKDAIMEIKDEDRREDLLDWEFSFELESRQKLAEQIALRSTPEYLAKLDFLKSQTWYRGLRTLEPSDPTKNPNTEYIVTITNCAIQAATYADDGVIATIKLKDNFDFEMHKPRSQSTAFSPLIFDDESRNTDRLTGIVVNGVTDTSGASVESRGFATPKVLTKVWRGAVNIGLHHNNLCLEAVAVEPAEVVVKRFIHNKLALADAGLNVSNAIPEFKAQQTPSLKASL